mgnify:FL=1
MATILERVEKLTWGEYFAVALYQIFDGIKSLLFLRVWKGTILENICT